MAKKYRDFNRQTSDFMRAAGEPSEMGEGGPADSYVAGGGPAPAAEHAPDLASGAVSSSAPEPAAPAPASASGSFTGSPATTAEIPPIDDKAAADTHRRKRRRDRPGYKYTEGDPVKPASKPIDKPVKDGGDFATGFKAYGEPLATDDSGEEFNELKAMEELLSSDGEYGGLPLPEVFNAYPPEVQRKIMEWTDRDVKARRDDESRRKDELVRATIERERRRQSIPAIIIVVAVLCGAVLGFVTQNPWFSAAFLVVPIAVIVAVFVTNNISSNRGERYRKPPK